MIFREMTVARVREPKEADHVVVIFLESARFYRLPKDHPAFDETLRLLKAAAEVAGALRIGLASLESAVILEVAPLGEGAE